MSSTAARILGYVAVWVLLAVPASVWIFLNSSTATVVASHDAVVRPTMDGFITVHAGPFLPDLRTASGSSDDPSKAGTTSGLPLGVDITLGKTEAASTDELVQRYAFIASQPSAQVAKVRSAFTDMAWDAALRGGLIAFVPIAAWLLLGDARRRELGRRLLSLPALALVVAVIVLAVLAWQPWEQDDPMLDEDAEWQSLGDYVSGVPLPKEAAVIQVRTDVATAETRRLVLSAVDTYEKSKTFYAKAAELATTLELRQPEEDETVALLVSDRHDNIGMDPVARAIADAGGATVVLDAGDDTSTGKPWEAFSLDSLDDTFQDLNRYAVAGNHDNGPFVTKYLDDRGWTVLDGEVVDGPGESLILGVSDPRSSGLGTWRDEKGLTFAEQADRIADAACDYAEENDRRVDTLLVHDANSGDKALERGCVDLVLSGHLHTQVGPTKVDGENGESGFTYTNGTTGGAAYAIAVGSKLRRPAEVTLVTYRDGGPVGVQPVTVRTDGQFEVADYVELEFD